MKPKVEIDNIETIPLGGEGQGVILLLNMIANLQDKVEHLRKGMADVIARVDIIETWLNTPMTPPKERLYGQKVPVELPSSGKLEDVEVPVLPDVGISPEPPTTECEIY